MGNLAKVKKVNVPSLGVVPSTAKPGTEVRAVSQSEDLRRAAEVAKSSTASLGKFQQNLNKKLESSAKTKGKKRQFESNTVDAESEKAKSLRVLDSITNKGGKGKFTGNSKGKNRGLGKSKAQKKKANP